MEKHVFKFGGGSWAVILPKAWIDKNRIDEKSALSVQEDELGNLIFSSKSSGTEKAELVVDSRLSPEVAGRWVDLYYRKGVKTLRVYAEGGAAQQFNNIEETVSRLCPGFEVISRSKNELLLEDFTDIKEVSIEKVILRLKSLISEELSEMGSVRSEEIAKLENLVNRFFRLGIRYINMTQGKNAINNFKLMQLLETISDQLYELAKHGSAQKSKAIFEQLGAELDFCFKALAGDAKALGSVLEARESIYRRIISSKPDALESYLLKEVSKNMVKVAELGLYESQSVGI